jgi:hypothetical protein
MTAGGLTAAARDNTEYETDAERDSDGRQRIAPDRGMGLVERIDGHILRATVLLARHTTDVSGEIADFFANGFGGLGGLAASGGIGGSSIGFVRGGHLTVLPWAQSAGVNVWVSARRDFASRPTANVSLNTKFPAGRVGNVTAAQMATVRFGTGRRC